MGNGDVGHLPMSRRQKTLAKVLGGHADANIRFQDICALLLALGFVERVRGSHHVFTHPALAELVNLQKVGGLAKRYQVRHLRRILLDSGIIGRLGGTGDE